jgi:Rieske Fe-S protein
MNRRTMVAGTGMIAAAAAIVGCSSYGSSDVGGATPATPPTTGEKGNASEGAKTGGTPETGQGEALGSAASIPVGGGVVYTSQQLVVTQPEPGTYRAFSAICTHKQCTVGTVADGTINCPCHGSKFAVADGSVVRGPAKKPLPAREVTVEGNTIRVV